ETPVVEVILDAGTADPADPPVHDEHLAVIEVRQRTVDEHLHPACRQAPVKIPRAFLGRGALPVDDDSNPNTCGRLRQDRLAKSAAAKASPTIPGLKPNWLR